MRPSSAILLGLSATAPVLAGPLGKRTDVKPLAEGDAGIVRYALILEHLEAEFYRQALANYTKDDFVKAGVPSSFYQDLKQIALDEDEHVRLLSTQLPNPPEKGEYTFASTTAREFLALAKLFENVGASAYHAAVSVVAANNVKLVASAIQGSEARHSAVLRALFGLPAFLPYDTPLNFNQVYSLVAGAIKKPGANSDLPLKPFPALDVVVADNAPLVEAGKTKLTFKNAFANARSAGLINSADTKVYAAVYSGISTYSSPVTVAGDDYSVVAPGASAGEAPPAGQSYVVLTTAAGGNDSVVTDANTIAGVGVVEYRLNDYVYPSAQKEDGDGKGDGEGGGAIIDLQIGLGLIRSDPKHP